MADLNAQSMLWPTYALRAWLTALLGQMERASDDLDERVEALDKEIARLRSQKQRSGIVIASLRDAVGAVDAVLRRTRDSESLDQGYGRKEGDLQGSKAEPRRPDQAKVHATERSKS